MNRIFILTSCLIFALLTSANAGELYSCIDRDGNTTMTTSPQDGMTKCVLKDSYRDPTPKERAKAQKEADVKARMAAQTRQTETPTTRDSQGPREDKCKGASDKWKDAYREYNEEKNRNNSGKPSSREKSLRAAMFKAQEEQHACIFSPENIESGRVYVEKTTVTIKRGK